MSGFKEKSVREPVDSHNQGDGKYDFDSPGGPSDDSLLSESRAGSRLSITPLYQYFRAIRCQRPMPFPQYNMQYIQFLLKINWIL